jgi:hypothetical protein
MPKFLWGAPQVVFKKKNGGKFVKTYHSRLAAAKSVKAYRSKGGKVLGTRSFGVKPGSEGSTRSGMTMRSEKGWRDRKRDGKWIGGRF